MSQTFIYLFLVDNEIRRQFLCDFNESADEEYKHTSLMHITDILYSEDSVGMEIYYLAVESNTIFLKMAVA